MAFKLPPRRRLYFWAFWVILHSIFFLIGFFTQRLDPNLSNVNKNGINVAFSRGGAVALLLDMFLILIPVCRTILAKAAPLLTGYLGIPLDDPFSLHKAIAWSILFFTAVHGGGFIITFNTIQNRLGVPAVNLHFLTVGGSTGWLMSFIMLFMYTTGYRKNRSKHYETFLAVHQLAIAFFILYILHPVGCFVKTNDGQCKTFRSNYIALPMFALYIAERIYRAYATRHEATIVDAIAHQGGVIELKIWAPHYKFVAGQHAKIQIPSLDRQWHPFTPTSAPHEEYVCFHIFRAGNWTNAMAALCGYGRPDTQNPLDIDPTADIEKASRLPLKIRLDGGFGTLTEGIYDRDVAILVCGGIGATPFASILKDLIWKHQNHTTGKLRRVDFYWICRTMESLEWFRDELARLEESSHGNFLNFYIHVTAKTTVLPSERLKTRTMMIARPPSHFPDAKTSFEKNPIVRARRGRPDFKQVFTDCITDLQAADGPDSRQKRKVGVYICGPIPLREGIRNDVKQLDKKGVTFGVFW